MITFMSTSIKSKRILLIDSALTNVYEPSRKLFVGSISDSLSSMSKCQ